MGNCSSDINTLSEDDVMNSRNTANFQLSRTVLNSCFAAQQNFFGLFCLYPPSNRSPTTCKFPTNFDPTFLFTRMNAGEFNNVSQLPIVISYPRLGTSLEDWVPTEVAPVRAMGHVTNLQAFATSNNNAGNLVSLGIANGALQMSQSTDFTLFRNVPEVPVQTLSVLNNVVVNGDASVRAAMFQDGGLFLWTSSSAKFNPIVITPVPPEPIIAYVGLMMWEDTTQTPQGSTFLAIVFQSAVAVYVYLYLVFFPVTPSTNPQMLSYNQTRIVLPFGGNCAWNFLEPGETFVYFAVTNPANNTFSTFSLSTNFNNPTPVIACCIVNNPFTTIPSIEKWYSIVPLPLDINGRTVVVGNENQEFFLFQFFNNSFIVPAAIQNYPNVYRTTQRGLLPVFADLVQVSYGPQTTIPPFVLMPATDFFTISPDSLHINVVSQDNGQFYQFDVVNGTWNTNFNLFDAQIPPLLNETAFTTHTEWFLGTTTGMTGIPLVIDYPEPLLKSRHSILQLKALSPGQFLVFQANVPQIVLGDNLSRIVRLYDNGSIVVYERTNEQVPIWESFTNDQEGSALNFETLILPTDPIAEGTLGAVSSPNSRYMLVVYVDRIHLIFNPFNAPKYTHWTNTTTFSNLKESIDAQSTFCFKALNNPNQDPLKFVDPRCTCLPSRRLLDRVYDPSSIDTLNSNVQNQLQSDVPCLLGDCRIDPAEYSNAAFALKNRCIGPNGICSQYVSGQTKNYLVMQDCGVNLRTCKTSADCPFGVNCRNGQCVTQCSSDATCMTANPLARCVNGQCQITKSKDPQQQSEATLWWVLVAVLSVICVVFLILVAFFGATKKSTTRTIKKKNN